MSTKLSLTSRTIVMTTVLVAVALASVPAAAQDFTSKVAVIDVRRILTESKAGQAALEKLRQLAEQKQAELASRDAELQELRSTIDTQRLSLAEKRLEEMERQLQDGMIAFRRAQDDARRAIEEEQATEFSAIEEKVMPLIQQIGEQGGYTLIFNKFEESGLLYAAAAADITAEVLQRFDALPEG